jgi:DNA (cytosine-5)-methyltransferase 1
MVYNANKKYFKREHCLHKDVKDLTHDEIPPFDILLAGFPCQPFSNAGNRQGIHDRDGRGTLFYECERALKSCIKKSKGDKPIAFVFENVKGITSSKMPDGTPVPMEIEKRMKRLGFKMAWKLVNASEYGVPQNRHRVIMVGVRGLNSQFDFDLLDEVTKKMHLPNAKRDYYELCLGSILSDMPDDISHSKDIWDISPSAQYMVENIGKCNDGAKALKKFRAKIPLKNISASISIGRSWKNMDPSLMSPRFQKIWDNPQIYRAPNFYRRWALGEICGTITASAQPENCGIIHPFENRRFSVREIARIQSFPDDFVFPYTSLPNAYKVVGNAVPPILGWVIGRALQVFLNANVK